MLNDFVVVVFVVKRELFKTKNIYSITGSISRDLNGMVIFLIILSRINSAIKL